MEAIIGFLTGILASMGLGGGFILVVWLTLFADIDQKTAQGINVLFFLPIAFISLIMHYKNKLINTDMVKKLALAGIVGSILGTTAALFIPSELLKKIFALFLFCFGIRELFVKNRP